MAAIMPRRGIKREAALIMAARASPPSRSSLMDIIRATMKGKAITVEAAAEPRQAKVVDLMERLRLGVSRRRKPHEGPGKGPRKESRNRDNHPWPSTSAPCSRR